MVPWRLASQRRAALYGSAALTITWSYSLDVLYLSYMIWYSSSTESSGAKQARAERARAPLEMNNSTTNSWQYLYAHYRSKANSAFHPFGLGK